MNKDELEGKFEKGKGKIKEKVGEMTGKRDLEAEGDAEQIEGEAQDQLGKARRKAGEAVEDVGDQIKGE